MIPSLPSYSSPSTPSYSAEPSFNEQSLDQTPAVGRLAYTGTYTKTSDIFAVTLTEQVHGTPLPTYGRNDRVKGTISLHDCSEITSVNITVSAADCPNNFVFG
jgi:hypothetical protein